MPFSNSKSGGSSRWGSSSSSKKQDPYSVESLERQIENAKLRIKDSGFSPEEDKRNWFEKATNLPKDQNALFDLLELIGRPGAAVLNSIDKGIDGGEVGEAAWRGFAGHDRITGSDFAGDKLGIDNKVGKFAAGLAIDIATDPTNFIPGKVFASGANAAGKGFKVGVNALEKVPGIGKAVEPTRNTLGKAFRYQYGWDETLQGGKSDDLKKLYDNTQNDMNFRSEEAIKNLTDIAKQAGLESGPMVGRHMEKDLQQFIPTNAFKLPDGRVLETKREAKFHLGEMKNSQRQEIEALGKALRAESRDYSKTQRELLEGLKGTNKEIDQLYFGIEKGTKTDLHQSYRSNKLDAQKAIRDIDDQLLDIDRSVKGYQKYLKNEFKAGHLGRFELLNRIKEVAPQGVKGLSKKEIPSSAWSIMRNGGKALDEVANELGYTYADDLVQDLKMLPASKKVDSVSTSKYTDTQMTRSGFLKEANKQKEALLKTREAMIKSLDELAPTTQDEIIDESFSKLANDPTYQQLKTQKDILQNQLKDLPQQAKTAKKEKIDAIKRIQQVLKGSKIEPTVIQKEHIRPVRELSANPKIQDAAQKLLSSNTELRQWAQDNKVDVAALEGYMKHVWSAAEREFRKNKKTIALDRGNRGIGQPNKQILKSRNLLGSAEDVNERMVQSGFRPEGHNFFEPNAFFSSAVGQKQLIEYVSAVKFRDEVLSDSRFAMKYKDGMDIPPNAVKIDINEYRFLKNGAKNEGDKMGGEYIVTKGTKEALDRYQSLTTDEGVKGMLKALDTAQNFWKKFALFSAGYHARNLVGAMVNNYIGGMSSSAVGRYTVEASKEVLDAIKGKESALFTEYRKQGLSSSNLSKVEFRVNDEPEKAVEKIVKERSKDTKGQILTRLNPLRAFETSRELGDAIDQVNRFALYKWSKSKGMTAEEAAAKVREVQFDYTRTTTWEKEYMSRAFPFYRWVRNNLPFQIRSFIQDPRKLHRMNELRLNAQDTAGIDEENVPEWMKNQFAIANVFDETTKDGKGEFFSYNLPMGDLTKLAEPGKLLVDSASPLAKIIPELVLNRNFFYNKPIEKFEGHEKQFQIPGTDIEFGIPAKAAYALEQATGQVGRGFSQYLQKPDQEDLDTKFRMPSLGISSLTKPFDAEQAQLFQLLDELRKLQDQIKYVEQQTGMKPRTVNEIKR